jgi:hypothetical protein
MPMNFERYTACIRTVTFRFRAVPFSDLARHNFSDACYDVDSKIPDLLKGDGKLKCS